MANSPAFSCLVCHLKGNPFAYFLSKWCNTPLDTCKYLLKVPWILGVCFVRKHGTRPIPPKMNIYFMITKFMFMVVSVLFVDVVISNLNAYHSALFLKTLWMTFKSIVGSTNTAPHLSTFACDNLGLLLLWRPIWLVSLFILKRVWVWRIKLCGRLAQTSLDVTA